MSRKKSESAFEFHSELYCIPDLEAVFEFDMKEKFTLNLDWIHIQFFSCPFFHAASAYSDKAFTLHFDYFHVSYLT